MPSPDGNAGGPVEEVLDPAPRPTMKHVPGLDGIRGVAVAAVVAYHLRYLSGGFLGVDVFFVLSGFLITSLLLVEVTGTGRINARRFWGRRIRRLVPAVLVLVPVVMALAWAVRWPRTRLDSLAWDAFSTLTWWANWRQASGTSYWDADTPSPFRHAWSLAIEEQFYLLWPLLLIVAATLARRRGRSMATWVGVTAAVGFALSSLWHVVLAHRLDPSELSRVYVGTDTRVLAPLAGCALACVWIRVGPRLAHSVRSVWWDLVAVTAVVVLATMVVTVRVSSASLYRNGGFVVAAVAAVALVATTLSGRSRLTRLAELGPVRWLGLRSYGIYLWSWPLQVMAEQRFPEADRHLVAVAVVITSLVVAEISFRLVEDPIRRGTFWAARPIARRPAWTFAVVAAAVSVIAASSYAIAPPAHEQIDTEESASMVTHPPPPPPPPPPSDPGEAGQRGLRVMTTGDSVIWTALFQLPQDRIPEGIATIDGRAVIGCGLMASDGWLYRSSDPDSEPFVSPAGGACAEQAEGERIGLTGDPDVVMAWPGAWETIDVQSPSGEIFEAGTPEYAELVVDKLVQQARAAHGVGAAFAIVPWACPGPDAPLERRTPEHLAQMQDIVDTAVERTQSENLDAFVVEPNDAVCVESDPLGEPTPEKNRAMNDEVHVKDPEGAVWVWDTWLAPALREHLAGTN